MRQCYAIDLDVLRTLRQSGPVLFEDLAARIGGENLCRQILPEFCRHASVHDVSTATKLRIRLTHHLH